MKAKEAGSGAAHEWQSMIKSIQLLSARAGWILRDPSGAEGHVPAREQDHRAPVRGHGHHRGREGFRGVH